MHSKAARKSLLREACYVAGVGAALESVYNDDLPARIFGLMLERHNRSSGIDAVELTNRREPLRVYLAPPKISGNRKQMRIAKNRLEVRNQLPVYRRGNIGPRVPGPNGRQVFA